MRNKDSDKIHIILFDKPFSITTISVSDKYCTFYELSFIDEFPKDKYVPNPPQLTMSLITQLIRREWNPPGITELLYTIISLHANTHLIQEIINNNLPINWGYIDSKGNTFLHKTCIHPQSAVFLQIIIQNVTTHKNQLINHSNKAKQTPLALLIKYIYDYNYYSTYHPALMILLKNGVTIIIQDLNTQLMRPIMEDFTIQQHNQSLVITFTVQQSILHGNWSMYALFSKPDEIFVIKTEYLTSFSQEDFVLNVSKIFNIILDLNCPEILDYIFDPKNSISKTNINQSQTRESFLNISAGECNSPLLFEHFIQDITDWNPKNPNENVLHICLSKKKYENFYILLVKIPLEVLNKLLFTPNNQNLDIPIYSMMDIPNTLMCTKLIIKKGFLDQNGNNLAHIAISSKKYDFLRVVIECSQNNTFTHKNKYGFNPLHLAIQESSIEATRLLLENSDKYVLTSTDNDGYNCFHSAIIQFNIDVFKAVLGVVIKYDTVSEDIIINIKTKGTATTPFLLSIEKQCLEASELLLSSGASIDLQDSKSQCFPYYIQKFCHKKAFLLKVLGLKVNQRNSQTLKSECCIEDLNFNSSPLLFYFWQYQDIDRFKEICAAFSFINLVKCNKDRNTILHLSLYNDKLTEYLLELFSHFYNDHKEETISFLDSINEKGETALSLAVTHSKPEAVRKILKLGVSLSIEFPGGDNILHIAIRTKNRETIAIFLCHPEIGQILFKPNDKKETPITSLLKSNGTGAINVITKVGKDIKGLNGESILHLVVQNGDEQTLLELFKLEGLSWSNLKDNNKRTPLHYAVVFSKAYAIELLVELGYDIFTPDDKRNTPMQEAIKLKDENVWREMSNALVSPNHVSQLPILLQFSVKMNNLKAIKDIISLQPDLSKEKKNIIRFAIESTSIPIWKRVFEELKCCADPKAIIETKLNDQTILVYCIKKINLTAFTDILTLTPDIDAVDTEGNTPLHHAAEYPEQSKILTSLIEYIQEHYNDRLEQLFSILNYVNLAPFHYAIWKNNLSAIDIFISHKTPFVVKKNSKLTLCALNSPLSINLYSSTRNNQLMIGYKVTPKSPNPPVWILSEIPVMNRDAIKKVVNTITKIDKLTDFHIKTILQCHSAEPVIAFLKQKLIQEDRKFDNGCSLLLYSAMYGTLSVVN